MTQEPGRSQTHCPKRPGLILHPMTSPTLQIVDQDGSHDEVYAILARHPDVTSAFDLMVQDMVSTLGWTVAEASAFVVGEAAVLLGEIDRPGFVLEWVVMENVQQRMHDEFIHTSWPECPAHGGHPLWLSETAPVQRM